VQRRCCFSGFDTADDVKKIKRLFPGNAPQLYSDTGITKQRYVVNIILAEKHRGGAADGVGVVVNISDIEFIEPEPQFEGLASRGDRTEQDNGFMAAARLEGGCLHKIFHIAYYYGYFPGNCHPDNRFPEHIRGGQVINYNNAVRLDIGNPGFQNLTMNQTIIHPDQGYVQRMMQVSLSGKLFAEDFTRQGNILYAVLLERMGKFFKRRTFLNFVEFKEHREINSGYHLNLSRLQKRQ